MSEQEVNYETKQEIVELNNKVKPCMCKKCDECITRKNNNIWYKICQLKKELEDLTKNSETKTREIEIFDLMVALYWLERCKCNEKKEEN